ncbi:MAG: mechanosensitive ion channel family protein [Thermoanaerobaculia bacterium]|nr:mechanosensitive ion channel family protein [Thermoanaerobaculia bacterium]
MEQSITNYLAEALGPWAANRWVLAAAVLGLALAVAGVADLVLTRGAARLTRRSRTDLDDRLLALLRRPLFLTVLAFGVWTAAGALALSDEVHRTLGRVIASTAILVWAVFALRFTSLLLDTLSRIEGRLEWLEPRTVTLFDNLSRLLLVGGAAYGICLVWKLDVGGILLGAGVLGLALGLAAKDTLANIFSGIFILADAPYQTGDYIVLDSGERGQVTQIGLRSTRLLTRDDIEVTVPNAVIGNAKIVNESGGPWPKRRVRVKVGVAYGSDVDRVRQVLEEIAAAEPRMTEEPSPRVRFRAFGDSSLDFELLGWIDEAALRGQVVDALLTAIYKRFAAEGIEIPFPQRDVHLHPAAPAETKPPDR